MRTFDEINEIMMNISETDYKLMEEGCLKAYNENDFSILDDLSMRIDLTPVEMMMMW